MTQDEMPMAPPVDETSPAAAAAATPEGEPREVQNNPQVVEAYLGAEAAQHGAA